MPEDGNQILMQPLQILFFRICVQTAVILSLFGTSHRETGRKNMWIAPDSVGSVSDEQTMEGRSRAFLGGGLKPAEVAKYQMWY